MNSDGGKNNNYREKAQNELDRRLDDFKRFLENKIPDAPSVPKRLDAGEADFVFSAIDYAKTALARNAARNKANGIHIGHRGRLRASERGDRRLDGFSDVELIELLLSFLIPQKDTNVTAHALIDKYGSVLGVLRAPATELVRFPSVTAQTAVVLPLLVYVSLWDGHTDIMLGCPSDAADFFCSVYLGGGENGTLVAYLDGAFGLITVERFAGKGFLPIRSVMSSADKYSARYIVAARRERGIYPDAFGLHAKVKELARTLGALRVRLLDFFMFTDYGYYTLGDPPKSGGWFPQYVFVPTNRYSRAPSVADRLTDGATDEHCGKIIAELNEFSGKRESN